MATRLKPTRINVDNTPRVWDGAAYQNDNDFHWSMGGWDMSYEDFAWHTLTGTSLVIEDISNNITPSSNFTVSAGTVKPGIEYVLRVNTGNTAYTMTLGTGVTNPNGYSTELTPNKVNQFKFIATSNSQLELEGVDTSEYLTWLTILSYGNSTWNDFITAYNKNSIVYCRASSNSNPASWSQTRLAFLAYVNNETTPTEVEFQYYRSRSSHSTAATVLDEVYVYKLTSSWTWTVTQRDTAAKPLAWTWIWLTYNASGMTISADTTVLATKTDLNSKQDVLTAGTWIDITSNTVSTASNFWKSTTAAATVQKEVSIPWIKELHEGQVVHILPSVTSSVANSTLKVNNFTAYPMRYNNAAITTSTDSIVWPANIVTTFVFDGTYWQFVWHGLDSNTTYSNMSATEANTWTATSARTISASVLKWAVETHSPVQSVNWQTWAVIVNDVKSSATAPSSPTEWMVWYDTTNNELKVYDWTNWNVTGKEYNAWPGIEIWTYNDYSAMRWPCPKWFHVPLSSELEALCEVVTTDLWLDSDGITMGTYLKMPIAGCRTTDSSIKNVGMYAYYWTATAHAVDNVEYIIFSSDSLFYHDWAYRASAFSIRWFRDSPVIPDNSWTTLYDWSSVQNGAWVFWNPSFWLISASSDWQNWITIQDKNLWATAVYNYWDTLSEANCGKFYQWGNNYWFPRTWTVTTSATQVDASNYWPWNYYSSDTFITRSASLYDWSSVQNDDLWWWVTWVVAIDNAITNTGVLSVNGQTWAVTVNEWDVKVFEVPAVNDDISDMVARLSAWKWVILHEMVSWTDAFYKVDYHDDVTQEITASLIYSYNGGYARYYTIVYNYSTKKVSTKTSSLTYFFAPETAGTQWQVLTKTNSGYEWAAPQWTTYNAGEWIEIWTIQDYSAMQWPAPDGFHVPLNTEWQAVKNIWTALGGWSSDWTNFWIALKLPFAGYRFCSSAGVGHGSYGLYWSSSRNNTNNAYLLNFDSSDVLPQNANYRAFGYSVRCFKNSPTVPTSSWTKLYWTSIEAWWIFWSSTEWLISMSSDWQTWITIQDKNLWATTVWNSWDTLSEANCWKYYQRWNNYWFPRTWSVTTSSTQVDASTYWPWNYYSSSTFITRNSSPYRWDTTDNWKVWMDRLEMSQLDEYN